MTSNIECFKAYDVRGRVPEQLNVGLAYRIGRAYAKFLSPKNVVLGYDIRLTSRALHDALTEGLIDSGVNVISIGLCGTEEIYFATSHLGVDGGIVVTASHNPKNYNGMKFVRKNSVPISGDTGLNEIRSLAESNLFEEVKAKGDVSSVDLKRPYVEHLLNYIDLGQLKPIRVVCNAGNGAAGLIIDLLEEKLPIEFIKIHHEPNGNFPNGVPNPLLEENRLPTVKAIKDHNAQLGIAWDGDFDRCFFFDELGRFVEGYYIVGLLAQSFLSNAPGSKIVHDPRLTWNTIAIAEDYDGKAVCCKTGHAFMKERMRSEDAVYGGEMSAHHYFKDFFYCDSGMIPWLLVVQMMASQARPLSDLVGKYMESFPASGEINKVVNDPDELISAVESHYNLVAESTDHIDGLSMNFNDWRFNIRKSITEPVIRLNVESRGNLELVREKTEELLNFIDS